MSATVTWFLIALAGVAAFGLSLFQARLNAGLGSDHYVHSFLIRAIRKNRFRLFTRIPDILNETHCAALPLYLHWVVARFGPNSIAGTSLLLNPIINGIHTVLVGCIAIVFAIEAGADSGHAALAAWVFALTPQFYHALSARNFGLSARGIGILLLTAFLLAGYMTSPGTGQWQWWIALVLSAYLAWAFSTFSAQAMVIISLLMALCFGWVTPLLGLASGLAVFVIVHPRYSLSYLFHTLSFIRTYGTHLAAVYILPRRFSIWRDLVWDIWRRIATNPIAGFRYAYENSVLIVALLNPALVLAVLLWIISEPPRSDAVGYATDAAVCGALAFLLTSFRPTRFLGEPERYSEAVTPWAALASAFFLADQLGFNGSIAIFVMLSVLVAAQLAISTMLRRHIVNNPTSLEPAQEAIEAAAAQTVRCTGNNEQLTKLMLGREWNFVFCMALERKHCEIPVSEAFTEFPFVRRESLQKIVQRYRINFCLLDRSVYDDIYDSPPSNLQSSETIYLSDTVRVIRLNWAEDDSALQSVAAE